MTELYTINDMQGIALTFSLASAYCDNQIYMNVRNE